MTLIDKAEALAPCPFCGGKAELNDCLVECGFCLCAVPDGFGYEGERLGYATEAEAIAAWNRRAALPACGVGDYTLAPHLQKIVDRAKTAPQWDTQADRLAALTPTDAAQAREAALREAVNVCKVFQANARTNDAWLHACEIEEAILALIGETRA